MNLQFSITARCARASGPTSALPSTWGCNRASRVSTDRLGLQPSMSGLQPNISRLQPTSSGLLPAISVPTIAEFSW